MRAGWRRIVLAVLLFLSTIPAHPAALDFGVGAIEHPAFSVQGVTLTVSDDGTRADLRVAQLAASGREWQDLHLHCPVFRLAFPLARCEGGHFTAAGLDERFGVDFEFDLLSRDVSLWIRAADGESWAVSLQRGELAAQLTGFRLQRLVAALPALAGLAPSGTFDGRVALTRDSVVELAGVVSGGGFASADGLQAAEGLWLEIDARVRRRSTGHEFSGHLRWSAGEAYVHPVYLTAPAALSFAGSMGPDALELQRFALEIDGARAIEARASIALPDGTPERFALSIASADLAIIGPRFIAPVLAPARAQSLAFDGHFSAGVVFEHGAVQSVDAVLDGVRFEDADAALSLGPLSGVVPWRVDEATQAKLRFEGGRWEALELGGFDLEARLQGPSVSVRLLEVPVLDGRLVLSDLALERGEAGWSGTGAAVVEPISMPLLSKAVGLPEMAGVLSASMPGLRVSPGELALDGALVISVFDGYLRLTDVSALEPFGVSSRLFANLTARNLDLAQLTQTFAFGGMTGFIDLDVDGLELANWRPVRFDARVASSPGRYSKRISQRAVENIGALAGPGAGLALQRSFLRFFEDFGYREIGLSCRLESGVCTMGGIGSATTGSFDIVRGGGIPALNIIGYNRRVDWDEFVGRVQRVIESNAAPVIR